MTERNTDYDNPWKTIIEIYFQDFMKFFFPWTVPEIDWSREIKFLDKELQKVVRDAEISKRYADKLVEVYKLDGSTTLVLCHVEVQAQYEANLGARMYGYNYRLRDRYDRDVASLVILGDDSSTWRPTEFRANLWGCSVDFVFPVVKLLDYQGQWDALMASSNPFAVVVMAHLKTMETHNKPMERKDWKYNLLTMLYGQGYSDQDILNLYYFLDWLMNLPEDLEQQFRVDLAEFEEGRRMKYVTSIERMAREEGRVEGRQERDREIILEMLRNNIPLEQISRYMGLTIEAIQQLQQQSN